MLFEASKMKGNVAVANWLLFYGSTGSPLVIGPVHHVTINQTEIRDDDGGSIARRNTGRHDSNHADYDSWTIRGVGGYDEINVCDGDDNPWPDYPVFSPDDLRDMRP
jgi:hypothetical protein